MRINLVKDKYNSFTPLSVPDIDFIKSLKDGDIVYFDVKKHTRTTAQNSALHLYYTHVSAALNEIGIEHRYFGISGKEFNCHYTPSIVKDFIWRPIQMAMYNIESTTDIDTEKINKIYDVINKFLGEKGVHVPFPSEFTKHYSNINNQ